MPNLIYKVYEPKDAEPRRIIAAVSSESIDRDGEIIAAAAMKEAMAGYMKNPVIMTYHRHAHEDGTPTVIGKVVKWWQDKDITMVEIEFADTALATQYWQLYAGKYQRAFSIGFNSLKTKQRMVAGRLVKVHTAIDLYEISAVGVPANPDAITKQHKDDQAIGSAIKAAVAEQVNQLQTVLLDQLDQVKMLLHGGTLGYAEDSLGESPDASDAGADAGSAETVLNRISKKLNESKN
jgi:HK97 family phage prohead protease